MHILQLMGQLKLSVKPYNTLTAYRKQLLTKSAMGGSRKYPYPYHGRHLGIPKGRGGYVDWNSEDMGRLRRLEFRGHGEGSLDWNSEGIRGFSGE